MCEKKRRSVVPFERSLAIYEDSQRVTQHLAGETRMEPSGGRASSRVAAPGIGARTFTEVLDRVRALPGGGHVYLRGGEAEHLPYPRLVEEIERHARRLIAAG